MSERRLVNIQYRRDLSFNIERFVAAKYRQSYQHKTAYTTLF